MVTNNTTSSRHTRIAFRITVHTQLHYLWWRLQLGNQTNQPMRKQNNLQTLPNLSIKYTFQLRRFKTKSSANEPQVGNHQKKKKSPPQITKSTFTMHKTSVLWVKISVHLRHLWCMWQLRYYLSLTYLSCRKYILTTCKYFK